MLEITTEKLEKEKERAENEDVSSSPASWVPFDQGLMMFICLIPTSPGQKR